MESLSALPKWVKKSRNTLKQSQEWQTFMMSLYDIVHHQMQESGVGSFSDLSPPERKLLLQRAFQALKKSETYNKLIELASDSLDNSLAYEASNLSLLKSQSKTRIQILQSECHKAVSALLQRWPDGRTSLQMCLNSIIPSEIRYVLWKSFLNNPKAREDYLKIVAGDPKKLVSDSDFEISQKCQNLLESVPTLRAITSKKATCSVMRHILSYRQTRTKENLIETDYLLSVPPVICTLSAYNTNNSLSASKPLTTEALATLVEEFTVFMDKRPDYMMSKQGRSLTDISEKTEVILRRINVKLCNSMENYHVGQKQVNSLTPGLQIVLSKLLHSVLRSMFVGFLPLDSVLHAWDILILGFDQPNYDPVPYLCASILLVLHEELMNCQTLKAAETALLRGCKGIDESRLAQAMSEYGFEKTLGENLSALQESQFPVFHPALESNMPPWKHWYSSKLIAHLQEEKWQSKQQAQTVIDDDAAKPSSSASGSSKAGQNQAWLLEQAKQELEEEVENLKEERNALLEGLQEERRTRVDVQEYADEEIERLRRQIIGLQSLPDERVVMASPIMKSPTYDPSKHDMKAPPPSVASSRSKVASSEIKPAPNSPVSPEVGRQVEQEPVPSSESPAANPEVKPVKDDNEEMAMRVTTDLLAKMMEGINILAQGSGKTRKELDQMSKKDIDKFHLALNKAQIIIFGKSMSDDDLESLPTAEREEKMIKVREETVKRLFNIK